MEMAADAGTGNVWLVGTESEENLDICTFEFCVPGPLSLPSTCPTEDCSTYPSRSWEPIMFSASK